VPIIPQWLRGNIQDPPTANAKADRTGYWTRRFEQIEVRFFEQLL